MMSNIVLYKNTNVYTYHNLQTNSVASFWLKENISFYYKELK